MKKTKGPVVLTVNGKAELVVQDAEGYQKLLAAKDRIKAIEGIRRGLESMKRQRGKPAAEFFQEFFAEKGSLRDLVRKVYSPAWVLNSACDMAR